MAKQFILSNGKFVSATVGGQKKFVVRNEPLPPPPTNLEVKATTVEFDQVSKVAGYNFYLDTVQGSTTYLGQMIMNPVPMEQIYPGTALYPNN